MSPAAQAVADLTHAANLAAARGDHTAAERLRTIRDHKAATLTLPPTF